MVPAPLKVSSTAPFALVMKGWATLSSPFELGGMLALGQSIDFPALSTEPAGSTSPEWDGTTSGKEMQVLPAGSATGWPAAPQAVSAACSARVSSVTPSHASPWAAAVHAASLDRQGDSYSAGVRLRLELGRYVLAEDYARAQRGRTVLTAAVDDALADQDALVLPSLAIPASPLGADTVDIDGRPVSLRNVMLRLTQLFNATGHPAVSIPCGHTATGLPIGLQLVGRRGQTDQLLTVAAACETALTGA